jgi:hypothetical protein
MGLTLTVNLKMGETCIVTSAFQTPDDAIDKTVAATDNDIANDEDKTIPSSASTLPSDHAFSLDGLQRSGPSYRR